MKEISTVLNNTKQQLTNIIKDLEIRGYLTKIPGDQQEVLVPLTHKIYASQCECIVEKMAD